MYLLSSLIIASLYICILQYSKAVQSQEVHLDKSGVSQVSRCSIGLIDGMDFYIFEGLVNATKAKYSNLVDFQIKPSSSNAFLYLCTASLLTCITPNPQPCYCAVQDGSIYTIVANRSAALIDSNATIRIKWDSSSGNSVFSGEVQVPKIHDLNNVSTSIWQNSESVSCPENVTYGTNITFVCHNAPSPCNVSISVNNEVKVKSINSVTYTVEDLAQNATHNFDFSYFVCGQPGHSTICNVTTKAKDDTPDLKYTTNPTQYTHSVNKTETSSSNLTTTTIENISLTGMATTTIDIVSLTNIAIASTLSNEKGNTTDTGSLQVTSNVYFIVTLFIVYIFNLYFT